MSPACSRFRNSASQQSRARDEHAVDARHFLVEREPCLAHHQQRLAAGLLALARRDVEQRPLVRECARLRPARRAAGHATAAAARHGSSGLRGASRRRSTSRRTAPAAAGRSRRARRRCAGCDPQLSRPGSFMRPPVRGARPSRPRAPARRAQTPTTESRSPSDAPAAVPAAAIAADSRQARAHRAAGCVDSRLRPSDALSCAGVRKARDLGPAGIGRRGGATLGETGTRQLIALAPRFAARHVASTAMSGSCSRYPEAGSQPRSTSSHRPSASAKGVSTSYPARPCWMRLSSRN